MNRFEVNVRRLLLLIALSLLTLSFVGTPKLSATSQTNQSVRSDALPFPSPTPRVREEIPQDSDEVVKVETNLTNIFFTAADKYKRFVGNLKAQDIRVLEDGQQQEIFTFQQNIDLPLSIAILIDTSRSEERVLPDRK